MRPLLTLLLLAGLWSSVPARSQGIQQLAVPNSPAYEQAAERLRDRAPQSYDFSKAMLGDVLRLLAQDAGISFFGLPDGAPGSERLVTFSLQASPFTALETIARANGISLIYERGIWYLRPADDAELVGRVYQINYNSQELVRKNGQGSSLPQAGGSGASTASSGLNLQGSPDFFVAEPSRLLEDIRSILDLGTTGAVANIAPVASVDTFAQLSVRDMPGQPQLFVDPALSAAPGAGEGDSRAKVIWNSDSNSLYVVATRQQHQWIEGYLATADQPQPMIGVEVKFLELSKDPRRELGIDWTGTLGNGYGASLADMSSPVNLDRLGDTLLPGTAILSFDEVNLKLRALFDDRRTRTVSYPRMVTLDNREVVFRSVVNQPVLGSSASASLGAGATETSSIEYIPIGTVINILPKTMADGKILLNISITVSDIIGTEFINGNPFPIASSRVYTAPVQVQSGYTVAISGLDQATDTRSDTGVPLLGRIPVLGYAFKFKGQSNSRQHLMMMITPTTIPAKGPGVGRTPETRDPWPPEYHHGARPVAPDRNFVMPHGFGASTMPDLDAVPSYAASAPPAPLSPAEIINAPAPDAGSAPEDVAPRRGLLTGIFSGRERRDRARLEADSHRFHQDPVPGVPAWSTEPAPRDLPALPAPPSPAPPTPAIAAAPPAPVPAETIQTGPAAPAAPDLADKVARLAAELDALPPDAAAATDREAKVAERVHRESGKLLDEINRQQRQSDSFDPANESWWALIALKTRAQQFKARSAAAPALAGRADPE